MTQNGTFEKSCNFLKGMCVSRNDWWDPVRQNSGSGQINYNPKISLSHDGARPTSRLLMQQGSSADARWSKRKNRVEGSHDTMTCFSTRTIIAQSDQSHSAELLGEGHSRRTGSHAVHSKSCSMDYVRSPSMTAHYKQKLKLKPKSPTLAPASTHL